MERLADLDELVLRCRTEQASQHLAEAVACYRAGAYRACIVATWVAVVYDILDKVRELALHGETKAKTFVDQFTAIQDAYRRGDPDALRRTLDFERSVLDRVRDDFEILTPIEHSDLVRLREDRNRCAHPTVNQPDEAYRPVAELARLHLRSAVVHVLQQAPAQGKAAFDALKRDLSSSYLPRREKEILAFLKSGPLAKARDGLTKDVVGWLVTSFFDGHSGPPIPDGIIASLAGVRRMHPAVAEQELVRCLRAEVGKLTDQALYLPVIFVGSVPDSWSMLSDAQQSRLRLYLEKAEVTAIAPTLEFAEKVEELSKVVQSRITKLEASELTTIGTQGGGVAVIRRTLDLLAESGSWARTNFLIQQIVLPSLGAFTEELIDDFLRIAAANYEVKHAFEFHNALAALSEKKVISKDCLSALLSKHELNDTGNDEKANAA